MFICEIALWAMAFFECRETDCHSPSGFAMTVFFVTCRIKIGAETIETHIIVRRAVTRQSHIPFCRAVISVRCRGRRPRRPACNVTNSPKCALKRNILPPGRRRRRPLQPISNSPTNRNLFLRTRKGGGRSRPLGVGNIGLQADGITSQRPTARCRRDAARRCKRW